MSNDFKVHAESSEKLAKHVFKACFFNQDPDLKEMQFENQIFRNENFTDKFKEPFCLESYF